MNDVNHEIFYCVSTIQTLSNRLSQHKNNAFNFDRKCFDCKKCNYIRLMNIDNNEGIKNIFIHLIESYPCNSKEELLEREKYYSKILNPKCNTYSTIRTRKDWNEYMRNFRKKNLEKIREYEKEHPKKI